MRAALPGSLLGCSVLAACSAVFGIEPSVRSDGAAAAGGESAGAGAELGRAGATANGGGGEGGQSDAMGGGGGASDTNAGGFAAMGGIAGGGAATAGPTLGAPCSAAEDEQLACTSSNRYLVLRCTAGAWSVADVCPVHEGCDPDEASCTQTTDECRLRGGSTCTEANVLLDCESDRPREVRRYCPYGCRGAECLPGDREQLVVHTANTTAESPPPLPRNVSVCWGSSASADERRWIQEEAETTWGRFLDVNFSGWGACDAGSSAGDVALDVESGCRGRLVNDFGRGVDAARRRGITFCRSSSDADGETDAGEALIRFLARHQFGHLVGLADDDSGAESVMARGVRRSQVAELGVSASDLASAQSYCFGGSCRKPSGAVVTTSGQCLRAVGGAVRGVPCVERADQKWSLESGELLNASSTPRGCAAPAELVEDAALAVAGCTEGARPDWSLGHVQWSSRNRCVTPHDADLDGSALKLAACSEVGDPLQSWAFELDPALDGATPTRIRFSGPPDAEYCVTVPGGSAVVGALPELRRCDATSAAEQTFSFRADGKLAFGELCLDWVGVDGVAYFDRLCEAPYAARWVVSGPLESSSGLVLSVSAAIDGAAGVTALRGSPKATQIFDFYF